MNKETEAFKAFAARVIIGIIGAACVDEYSADVVNDGADIVGEIYDAVTVMGVQNALGDWFETQDEREGLYQSFQNQR